MKSKMNEKQPENPITKILEKESENVDAIHLYRVGAVYRAYEQSAYYFVKRVKLYKVLNHHYKEIGREILYTGFYANVLHVVQLELSKKNLVLEQVSENHLVIKIDFAPKGFDRWKSDKLSFLELEKEKLALQKNIAQKESVPSPVVEPNINIMRLHRRLNALGVLLHKVTGELPKNAKFAYGEMIRDSFIELLQHVYLVQRGVYAKVNVREFLERLVRLQCILDFMNSAKIMPSRPFYAFQKKVVDIERSIALLN